MRISKKLYIDEKISQHRWVIWRIKKNKKINDIYCILYIEGKFLEIINSNKIKYGEDKQVLIGIAKTKRKAQELLVPIFDDIYVPNPNIEQMKQYFIENSR